MAPVLSGADRAVAVMRRPPSGASPLSGEAVRAGLTGIFSGFRAALEEEIGTGRRTTARAVRDGARDAR